MPRSRAQRSCCAPRPERRRGIRATRARRSSPAGGAPRQFSDGCPAADGRHDPLVPVLERDRLLAGRQPADLLSHQATPLDRRLCQLREIRPSPPQPTCRCHVADGKDILKALHSKVVGDLDTSAHLRDLERLGQRTGTYASRPDHEPAGDDLARTEHDSIRLDLLHALAAADLDSAALEHPAYVRAAKSTATASSRRNRTCGWRPAYALTG